MKKVLTVVTGMVVYSAMLLSSALTARADSGIWTNEVDGVWSDTAAWLNGIVADGAGNTATFSNQAAASVVVTLDSGRTIGNLEFIQGTYTITNDGPLTLAGPTKPVINVPAGNQATIARTILAGTDGFILDGGGTLNLWKAGAEPTYPLDPANTLTGNLILSNGTLAVQSPDVINEAYCASVDLALSNITSVTFYNGSVLNLRPDPSTTPAYGTFNANLIVPEGQSGTIILPVRFSGASGDGATAVGTGLGGTLTGSGTLEVQPKYLRPNVVGDWSAFAGRINITVPSPTSGGDEFRYGHTNGLPNADVHLTGSSGFTFRHYLALTTNRTFRIGMLSCDNSSVYLAGSATAAWPLLFEIGAKQTNATDEATFAGNIVNGAGPAGVIWRGAGTWRLTGSNTYTGPTIISNGVLVIGDGWESGTIGSGPITNYSRLVFDRGGAQPLWVMGGVHGTGSLTNNGSATVILARTNTYTGPTVISNGKVHVGSGSVLPGGVTVAAGAGFGVRLQTGDGSVRVGSLSLGSDSTLDYDFGTAVNPPQAILTNSGVLTMNGNVTVNITGFGLTNGTITLLTYASRSGSGTFNLGALPIQVVGATLNDDTVNKRLTLIITDTYDPTLVWVGDAAGVWDVDNPGNKVWKAAATGQSTYFTNNAWVRFDDTAVGTTTINIVTSVSPGPTVVDNTTKDYTFGGAGNITGGAKVMKRGAGKLIINTAGNNWSGGTVVEAGTFQIGDGTTAATIDGTFPITNDTSLVFNSTADNVISAVIAGTGRVIQEGAGVLTLSGANTHTGGVEVRSGATLNLNNSGGTAAGAAGAPIVLNGGILQLGQNLGGGYTGIVTATSIIYNTGDRRFRSPIVGTNQTLIISNTALFTFNADIQGFSGTIVLASPGNQTVRFNEGGENVCTGSRNALFLFQPGDPTATNWLISRNAGVMELGGIAGGPGRLDQQGSAGGNNTVTYSIGWLGLDTVWTGLISDSGRTTAVAKVGIGRLTLTNVGMWHKGLVTVSNGVLAFAGETVNSGTNQGYVIVSPGILDLTQATDPNLRLGISTVVQTLSGDGTLQGNLVMGANGRLAPGLPVGVLTVSGSATLAGITTMEINRTNVPNSDMLVVGGTLTGGGTLVVTNIGPAELAAGDTFALFNKPVSGFSSVVLPSLAAPLFWTNKLAVDGTIQVLSTVPTTPTNIMISRLDGGLIEVGWPASHIGWRLETNAVSIVATNEWYTWIGSTTTNRVIFPIDTAKTNVYFRLVYP